MAELTCVMSMANARSFGTYTLVMRHYEQYVASSKSLEVVMITSENCFEKETVTKSSNAEFFSATRSGITLKLLFRLVLRALHSLLNSQYLHTTGNEVSLGKWFPFHLQQHCSALYDS